MVKTRYDETTMMMIIHRGIPFEVWLIRLDSLWWDPFHSRLCGCIPLINPQQRNCHPHHSKDKDKDKGEGKDKDIHKYNKIVDKCVRPSNQPPTTQLSSSSFHLEGTNPLMPLKLKNNFFVVIWNSKIGKSIFFIFLRVFICFYI